MPVPRTCWKCGASTQALFCPACNTLQPPPSDYFQLFELHPALSIDLDDLQRRFYALSRQLHPDRFQRKSGQEQEYSLEATAVLNDAYRALRDPVQRAEYMLKRNGFAATEQRSKDVPPELLEEVFEFNMALEELRDGDSSVRPQLSSARERFLGLRNDIDTQLGELFSSYDRGEQEALATIRGALNRRRYIQNLVNETDKALAA